MHRDDYLNALQREGDALLVAGAAALDAPVRACPGWKGADLVYHMGMVHNFWRRVVAEHWTEYREGNEPARPDDADLVDWARVEHGELLQLLRETDPATPVWTWARAENAAWVIRRTAHETTVHRWDAEVAAGIDAQIVPEFASDGVDEYLEYFLVTPATAPGSVHLHATDAPGEWLVVFDENGPKVTREHAKGDAAMRGPAATLLLALWGRAPLSDVDVIGDASAAERLIALGFRG